MPTCTEGQDILQSKPMVNTFGNISVVNHKLNEKILCEVSWSERKNYKCYACTLGASQYEIFTQINLVHTLGFFLYLRLSMQNQVQNGICDAKEFNRCPRDLLKGVVVIHGNQCIVIYGTCVFLNRMPNVACLDGFDQHCHYTCSVLQAHVAKRQDVRGENLVCCK